MGLFLDTARAVVTLLKERANEVAATALLRDSLRAINAVAAPHWKGSSLSELPDMIRELARDRDDFKTMATAYREELANAERRVKELEIALKKASTYYSKHEAWCNVFGRCNCSDLDEDDVCE